MEYILVILVAAVVFGICFVVDKVFTKIFRSQAQHKSGRSVRLSKGYGSFGMIMVMLGLAAIFRGAVDNWLLLAGGVVILVVGTGLVVYYMTYAVFYDDDGFIFNTFGKKPVTYTYGDIQAQQLYNNQGRLLIELYMADGNAVHLQSGMTGCFEFMDFAFSAWLRQNGKTEEECPFHDPANSCWFPPVGE